MDHTKKFGLVMPKKSGTLKAKAKSIFDSDSEDDAPKSKRPKIPQKKINFKKQSEVGTLEDPSIYEYDSIYDDMKAKQAESIAPKEKQNSRYIETLLKAADKRKKQYERRVEKKIQVEREKEGDKFKDKEEFVTSTYKKKMQEREEEEEKERREAMLNDMMDVKKQKDLSGFYRHFLKQTVGEEKVPTFGEKYVKQEVVSDEEKSIKNIQEKVVIKKEEKLAIKKNEESETNKENAEKEIDYGNLDRDSDGIEIDSDDDSEKMLGKKKAEVSDSSSSESDRGTKNKKGKHRKMLSNAKVTDDDSDESSKGTDSKEVNKNEKHKRKTPSSTKKKTSSDSDTNSIQSDRKNKSRKQKKDTPPIPKSKDHKYEKQTKSYRKSQKSNTDSESEAENVLEKNNSGKIADKQTVDNLAKDESKVKTKHSRHDSSDDSDETEVTLNHAEKPSDKLDNSKKENKERRNIYAKRTVGDIFSQAQARYFQRLAERNS